MWTDLVTEEDASSSSSSSAAVAAMTTWTDVIGTTSSAARDGPSTYQENVPIFVAFYISIVLIVIGLVCNSLSIGVFVTSPTLRRTTTGQYLVALAVADTLFLVGAFARWFSTVTSTWDPIIPLPSMHDSRVVCKSVYVLRYAFKFMSAWITVVITVERFLTVAFPLQVGRISTRRVALVVIVLTALVSVALNLYPIWLIDLQTIPDGRVFCMFTDRRRYDLWSMVVLRIGQLIVPSVLIFFFTALIIYYVRRASRHRRLHLSGYGARKSSGRSVETQLTIMLISVAVASLVFRLPYMLAYYMNLKKDAIWPGDDEWISYRTRLATNVTHVIALLNYVLNFFFYCLCGSAFRTQLVHWLPFCRHVVPHDSHYGTTNASATSKRYTTATTVPSAAAANSAASMSTNM